MRQLTANEVDQLFPGLDRARCAQYAPHLTAALNEAKINTRKRLCAFVPQLGHESEDLRHLREIWGPTPAQARYDTRVDLGNTPDRDGDGKKFMGRGGLQRTGKKNYRRAAEALKLPLLDHPELLEKPEHAFRSDALYWNDNNLNRLADALTLTGDHRDLKQFDKITKRINGGYNGRVDRQRRYLIAIATLPDDLFQEEAPAEVQTSAPATNSTTPAEVQTSAPMATPAVENSATSPVLLEKIANHKETARGLAKKGLARFAAPAATFYTALKAGEVKAWLALVVIAAAGAWACYHYRGDIRRYYNQLLNKL
jgi:putative chitinase